MCLFVCASAAHAQSVRRTDPLESFDRLLVWLENVQRHVPDTDDIAAREVAGWSRVDLDTLAADLKQLSAFVYRAHRNNESPLATLRLHNRAFTLLEIDKTFLGNATLLRGALLHADIAMYVVDDLSRRTGSAENTVYLVDDGRGKGTRHLTVHWQIGRLVLDAIAPSPIEDASALQWYRAVAAYLLREGHLGEARVHLEKARQLFPSSADVFLDNAYLREKYASPEIQAAVQDLRSEGLNIPVDSDRAELGRAERFLRQTLALDPARLEARIRLGRVLGELERHQDAAAELRQTLDAGAPRDLRYFAELFLGREEVALGNRDAGRVHFQAAAALFPKAQSPHLALSQLARQSGDRAEALRALQQVTSLPSADFERVDPWWAYYAFHADDVEALMDAARERAFENAK